MFYYTLHLIYSLVYTLFVRTVLYSTGYISELYHMSLQGNSGSGPENRKSQPNESSRCMKRVKGHMLKKMCIAGLKSHA
jgi:hypothetical protein